MAQDLFDSLWENKDYREQVAWEYLKGVFRQDVKLSNIDLYLVRSSINTVLHEEYREIEDCVLP